MWMKILDSHKLSLKTKEKNFTMERQVKQECKVPSSTVFTRGKTMKTFPYRTEKCILYVTNDID